MKQAIINRTTLFFEEEQTIPELLHSKRLLDAAFIIAKCRNFHTDAGAATNSFEVSYSYPCKRPNIRSQQYGLKRLGMETIALFAA